VPANYDQDPKDPETGYFFATKGQVNVMKANPYLEVDAKPFPDRVSATYAKDPNAFMTVYYYPDPRHYKGIAKKLGPLASQLLSDYTGQEEQFKNHTQLMIRQLLVDAFTTLWNKPVGSGNLFSGGLDAMLVLVSIHPCSDFNGRTTRFYGKLAALDSGMEFDVPFMSDFDLVTPVPTYAKFLQAGTDGANKLKVAMLGELLSAAAQNRTPRHYDLPEWAAWIKQAMSIFGTKNFVNTPGKGVYTDAEADLVRRPSSSNSSTAGSAPTGPPETKRPSSLTHPPLQPLTSHPSPITY